MYNSDSLVDHLSDLLKAFSEKGTNLLNQFSSAKAYYQDCAFCTCLFLYSLSSSLAKKSMGLNLESLSSSSSQFSLISTNPLLPHSGFSTCSTFCSPLPLVVSSGVSQFLLGLSTSNSLLKLSLANLYRIIVLSCTFPTPKQSQSTYQSLDELSYCSASQRLRRSFSMNFLQHRSQIFFLARRIWQRVTYSLRATQSRSWVRKTIRVLGLIGGRGKSLCGYSGKNICRRLSSIFKYATINECPISTVNIIQSTRDYKIIMKNLHCLAEFLGLLATAQTQLQSLQLELHKACPNPNELFRGLSRSNTVQLSKTDLEFFIKSFSFDLYRPEIQGSNYKLLRKPANKDKLLSDGVSLLLREYGSGDSLTYDDFCWLAFGDNETSLAASARNGFGAKQALFNLLQTELQNLTDIENFKRIVVEETPRLEEAFKVVTNNKLAIQNIQRLLNVNGIFLGEEASKILVRLKGELSEKEFVKYFQTIPPTKQTKIFQSSIKKRDLQQSNVSFGTPIKKSYLSQASTGRKPGALSEVKAKELKQDKLEPNRFQILQQIAAEQTAFDRKKQSLLLDRDIDLQLAYDTLLDQFSPTLTHLYKDSSFTSFLRFLFPTTWQHQYLGFIRYNIDNRINSQTLNKLRQVKTQFELKEAKISELWRQMGPQKPELFKSISSDAACISKEDLAKYFPEKSVKMILRRMDRMGSGRIGMAGFC